MADDQNRDGGRSRGGLRRGVVTLVIILGIVWVTAFFALGTKGGHEFVQSQMSKRLGTEVTLERASLAFPAAVRLTQLQSADYAPSEAGFRADEVRLALGVRPWLRITLQRPELNLVEDGPTWYPTYFAALGPLPERELAAVSDLSAPWRGRVALEVVDGRCVWHRGGTPWAAVEGLAYQIESVQLPGRDAAFYQHLQAKTARPADGREIDNVDVEWLAAGSARYIEMGRSPSVPPAAEGGFWGVADDTARGY